MSRTRFEIGARRASVAEHSAVRRVGRYPRTAAALREPGVPRHEVRTAVEMGWSGVTNGRLLALAADKFKANRVGPRT
jgi:hypothetical protein